MSIAARASPRRRSPSSTRGSGQCSRFAAWAICELAGNPDVVAGPRARALERHPGRHLADGGDRNRALLAARGVAADQLDAEALGKRVEACGKRLQPRGLGSRQSDRQRRPARRGTHRGKIGEVDGERLVAERARLDAGKKMPAFDQHVGGHGEIQAGIGPQQRAIVADAESRTLRRPREIAADQFELVHQARLRQRLTSSGRSCVAIFSSTPLTKR
jgi:hypothetical protein